MPDHSINESVPCILKSGCGGGGVFDSSAFRATGASARRKLGSLDVFSVGLSIQSMIRKYETTVPYRPEMIDIIRAALDHGVTFIDTAEAYGPFECERILDEGVEPFRNRVGISSKFGWNIDPATGRSLRRHGIKCSLISLFLRITDPQQCPDPHTQ